jgi:predicted NBD/HSP70 family sugar kinase
MQAPLEQAYRGELNTVVQVSHTLAVDFGKGWNVGGFCYWEQTSSRSGVKRSIQRTRLSSASFYHQIVNPFAHMYKPLKEDKEDEEEDD